jgi:hypothetical protein
MQLFILRRKDACRGEYCGFVVACNGEDRARELAARYASSPDHKDDGPPSLPECRFGEWISSPRVTAKFIGEAAPNVQEGVVFVNYRPNDRDNE